MKRILVIFLLTYSVNNAQWVWQNPLPQGNPLGSIYFVDSNTGWTVGTGGTILKTTNGGDSWETQNSGTEEYLFLPFLLMQILVGLSALMV